MSRAAITRTAKKKAIATSGPRPGKRPEAIRKLRPSPRHEWLGNPEAASMPATPEVQKLLAEKQELMDTLVRRQADFENYRKRIEKERHPDRHRGVELLVEHLLPVLDAFDRALAGDEDAANAEYRKGFELIRRQIWDALAKQGLKRIESVGKEFDPHFHHAIERVETAEHADGTVIGELQPGYTVSRSRPAAGDGPRRSGAGIETRVAP